MAKRNDTWANLDWLTMTIYMIMVILGWINIYAAVYNEDHSSILDMSQRYGKQLIWIIAALVLGTVIIIIDSKFYVSFAYILYGFVIFSLIAVLLFGVEVNGSKSWFRIGGFAIQPSEFAKFATALALAKFAGSYNFKLSEPKTALGVTAILALPVSLIFLQNDTGSALVFVAFILVLYREGLPFAFLFLGVMATLIFVCTLVLGSLETVVALSIITFAAHYFVRQKFAETARVIGVYILIFGITMAINSFLTRQMNIATLLSYSSMICVVVFIIHALTTRRKGLLSLWAVYALLIVFSFSVDYVFDNVLGAHQQERIKELLGMESNPLGAGYHVNQSKIAIGSGGLTGKGFLEGTQTKFDFVPEQSTDFIFCTVGEEWGFAGSAVVLLLFLLLILRLIFLAERQRSSFSRIYGYSVACILFFHLAINTGMTIGLVPVIGIPLPFFSYGGSSLWSFTILLFIFLRLDASRVEKLSH